MNIPCQIECCYQAAFLRPIPFQPKPSIKLELLSSVWTALAVKHCFLWGLPNRGQRPPARKKKELPCPPVKLADHTRSVAPNGAGSGVAHREPAASLC